MQYCIGPYNNHVRYDTLMIHSVLSCIGPYNNHVRYDTLSTALGPYNNHVRYDTLSTLVQQPRYDTLSIASVLTTTTYVMIHSVLHRSLQQPRTL